LSARALALSRRALQVSSRAKAPVILRGSIVLCLFLAVFGAHESAMYGTATGADLLAWMAWTDWILINLLGVTAFSSVITQEKEVMSLGLLRLAGFSAGSLLLGKSIGLLLQALFLLLVQVPFVMLAITLGGVSLEQVLSVYALLLSYLMLVYSVSLLSSVVMRRNRTASIMATLVLLAYHLVPTLCIAVMLELKISNSAASEVFVSWQSSTAVFGLAQSSFSLGGVGLELQPQIYASLSLAALFFAAAWMLFGVCTRNETMPSPSRSLTLGNLLRRNRKGSLRVWGGNPFLWKDYQFTAGGLMTTFMRCLLYLAFIVIAGWFDGYRSQRGLGEFVMGTMCFVIVVEIGLQLGRVFQQEVKEKTLASLFSTPQPLPYIVVSKILGCLWIAVPSLLYIAVGAILAPRDFASFVKDALPEPGFWMFISIIITGFHLTVYYSLRFSRGAFALALTTMFLATTLSVTVLAGSGLVRSDLGINCLAAGITLVLGAACVGLCFAITARLRVLIAED